MIDKQPKQGYQVISYIIQKSLLNEISHDALLELHDFVHGFKTSAFIPLPSEWAAENRYLPPGTTEFPGLIDHSVAPHMVEIQDAFHPDSGIKQGSIMKGTQSLATTALENVIGHSIKYKLHNILYIISSKNIAGIRSSSAIDVMIDNSNLSEFVKPISTRMKRKVADNKYYKELHGGRRLMLTSWNSIGDAKSLSWDLIIMDEIDEAPYELKGQGDPEAIFAGRGKTVRGLKIAKISTPTTTHGRIYRNFLDGDQRYYYCKCPFCGELQVLTLKAGGKKYGLTAKSETIDNIEQIIADTVIYICEFCKKEIREHQKQFMLLSGKWKPTARPVNPAYRSWHVSNLMSPVMFYSWRQVMQEFCETGWGEKITKFKNFVIDVTGMPWEARTEKKNWEVIQARAEEYPLAEEMPAGALMPVGGADIQKNRIELTIVGWGIDMESWIIDHQIFWGETKYKTGDALIGLRNFLRTKKYKIKDQLIPIALTAIDTGYNPKKPNQLDNDNDITTEHIVYDFVAKTPRTIACRGNPDLRDMVIKEERVKRRSLLKRRYDVAVNDLKDETYIKMDYVEGTVGMIHFSKNLSEEYFRGFVSEIYAETLPGKWGWKKIYDRNEPLDCYILSRAAAEWLGLPQWPPDVWRELEDKILKRRR